MQLFNSLSTWIRAEKHESTASPSSPPPPRKHLRMSDHNITRARFSPRFALKIDRALLQR